MKTDCNIIKDLLPLYIDKIASKESNELIEEHLLECEKCKDALDSMKENIEVSSIDEKKAMKKFFQKIKQKRFISITVSIVITIFLAVLIWSIFNKRDFLMKYKDDLITVEEQENGELIMNVNTLNYTTCQLIAEENDDGSIDIYITLFQSLIDKFYPTEESKGFGIVPKCYKNYIEENVDINWTWENNKGKIILTPHNNVQIANIYYLENKKEFDTILNSFETTDPAFELKRIWENH